MALEDLTGTKYIDDLNSSNPAAGDNVSEGDDHIRGIKNVLKTTFPNIDGAVNATDTELNYVDGVTSAIQTQLGAKLPLAGGTMTGDLTLSAGGKVQYNADRYFTPENNIDGAEVSANGIFRIKTGTTPVQRILVGANGDISFYDDAGSSQDLFWDASESRLGISDTSPSAPLDVRGTAESYTIYCKDTDNVCNQASHSVFINKDISGSDACTTDRVHTALYIDVDSSATGGDTSDEHRIYGIYNEVNSTGDSDAQYSAFNYIKVEPSAGTVTVVKGAYNYAIADPDSGASVTSVYSAHNKAYARGAGDITTVYGNFSWANIDSTYTGSNIVNATGVLGEVEMDASGTLDNAYGVQSVIDRNAGTITNGYLFYGNYTGTTPTNAYGVYIVDDVDNYFEGNVGIGVTPESWHSTISALQLGGNATFNCTTTQGANAVFDISNNVYVESGSGYAWYVSTDEATQYRQRDGKHTFYVAPSGTADTAITWTTAMEIENNGNTTLGKYVACPTNGGIDSPELFFVGSGWNTAQGSKKLGAKIACVHTYGSGGSGQTDARLEFNLNQSDATSFTTKLAILGDGDVEVSTGNLVIGTAGKGIDFSAQTPSSSGTVASGGEVLDHYEEGTWTPALHGYTTSGTETYSQQTGKYTKIGNMVYASFYVLLSDKGNITGNYTLLKGLPFNHSTANGGSTIISGYGGLTSNTSWVGGDLSSTANWVWLTRGTNSTSHSNMNTSEITDITSFTGTLVYRV
jgi:hypothetical protein